MDKNEKEALDAYRQERKERIAKQSKSNAKKSHSNPTAKSAAGKVFGAVVAIAVVVALLAGILSFFAVPQKLTKAIVIDGEGYSMSELSCYYMQMYNNVYQTAASYDSNYGEGYGKMLTGYDVTLSPAVGSNGNPNRYLTFLFGNNFCKTARPIRIFCFSPRISPEFGLTDFSSIATTSSSVSYKFFSSGFIFNAFSIVIPISFLASSIENPFPIITPALLFLLC